MPNALAHEKASYLLQQRPTPCTAAWGEGAFAQARVENKPIFLSIGYSTAIGATMAHESLEDDQIAAILNEHSSQSKSTGELTWTKST